MKLEYNKWKQNVSMIQHHQHTTINSVDQLVL